MADETELETIYRLLQENGTLGEVSQYLKRRGLRYSAGNWEELIDKRLTASLEKGDIRRDDLVELLRRLEEHGGQHVFLYYCSMSRAKTCMDRARIELLAKEMGIATLLARPRIIDMPRTPTVSDLRWDSQEDVPSLVLKVIEQRVYRKFIDETTSGDYLVRRYRELNVRAVNLFKLRMDGLLELRIYSHLNASDYKSSVGSMWALAGEILPRRDFKELSITKAKTNLWDNRKSLRSVLRYSDSTLRNSFGTVLSAATGSEQMSLFDDAGASSSLDEFLRHDAYCDTSNVWWIKGKHEIPTKDIHVLLLSLATMQNGPQKQDLSS